MKRLLCLRLNSAPRVMAYKPPNKASSTASIAPPSRIVMSRLIAFSYRPSFCEPLSQNLSRFDALLVRLSCYGTIKCVRCSFYEVCVRALGLWICQRKSLVRQQIVTLRARIARAPSLAAHRAKPHRNCLPFLLVWRRAQEKQAQNARQSLFGYKL